MPDRKPFVDSSADEWVDAHLDEVEEWLVERMNKHSSRRMSIESAAPTSSDDA